MIDARTGDVRLLGAKGFESAHVGRVVSVAFTTDALFSLSGEPANRAEHVPNVLMRWAPAAGVQVAERFKSTNAVTQVAVSRDGRSLLVVDTTREEVRVLRVR